jgi:hypothetical protein
VLIGKKIALVGSGAYASTLAAALDGVAALLELDGASVVRAVGRERISGVELRTPEGSRRVKVDALAFDGPGAPSFELFVQAGAQVDFEPGAGYFPRVAADGSVAQGVFDSRAHESPALARQLG